MVSAYLKMFLRLAWEDLVPGTDHAARVYLFCGIIYGVTALLMKSSAPFFFFAISSVASLALAGLNYYSVDYQRRHGSRE